MMLWRHGVAEREAIALISSGNATNIELLQLADSGHWVIQFDLRSNQSEAVVPAVLQAKRGQTRDFKRITGAIKWLTKAKVTNAQIQLQGCKEP